MSFLSSKETEQLPAAQDVPAGLASLPAGVKQFRCTKMDRDTIESQDHVGFHDNV